MQEVLQQFADSQAPWMLLSIVLVVFLIKLQNDKMTQMLEMMMKLVVLYEKHDGRACEIKDHTDYIKEWCAAHGALVHQ